MIEVVEGHPNKVLKRLESVLEAKENNMKRMVEAKFLELQSVFVNKR